MELYKTLFTFIGVVLGWGLSEFSRFRVSKKLNEQKVNKLIFYFLEVRFLFCREINIEKRLSLLLNELSNKVKVKVEFGIDNSDIISQLYPSMRSIFKEQFTDSEKLDYLITNIDKSILELSEIMPTLAYDLSGKHNIKERLYFLNRYISEHEIELAEVPFDHNDWIEGIVNDDMINELSDSINILAKKTDRKIKRQVRITLNEQEVVLSENLKVSLDKYLNDFVEKMNEYYSCKNGSN